MEIPQRPSREELHMRTAMMWAKRALCSSPGRQVGCVITNNEMTRIISFGYNGPAHSLPDDYCCTWKESHSAGEHMSRCPCVHAEVNAISKASESLIEARLFVTLPPCEPCAHVIVNSGVAIVHYTGEYTNTDGLEVLKRCRKILERMELSTEDLLPAQKTALLRELVQGVRSLDQQMRFMLAAD